MRPPVRGLLVAALAVSLVPLTQAQGAVPVPPLPLLSSPQPPASGAAALAPVRLSLSSTSDWSVVKLTGARIIDLRVRSTSDGARLSVGDGTFGLRAPTGGGSAEIDAVLAVPGQDASLSVEKGWHGAAHATLRAGSASPVTASSTAQTQPAVSTATVAQDALADAAVRPPPADERKLVLAFYYPWFSNYEDWRLAEKPASPRSATDPAGVLSMTQQARANGIDGFVVSWSQERNDGIGYDLAVRAAEQTGALVAPYLEVGALADRSLSAADLSRRVHASLAEVLERSASPAVLRAEGVPVVFSFQTDRLPAAAWREVLATLAAEGRPIRLVGDVGGDWYEGQWGVHRYFANDSSEELTAHWSRTAQTQRAADLLDGTRHLVTATVSPGYDDRRLRLLANRPVPREGGARYHATWDSALAADPDWVLVTSWNEWYEGTSVEPGVKTGGTALEQTRGRSERWKAP